ncbi:MAG: Txe/YoeB family addiction module toxin [Moorea sp. SIO2I5]|nr:Txe/YoeB family addiction module toxin [Moorena sp. SIO2I5]
MSRDKRKKDRGVSNPADQKQLAGYVPVFSPDFKADLRWWYRNDFKKGDKILDLVADSLNGDPFTGLGKPEPLKYMGSDIWSRRIDLEHRLVYKVSGNRVYFLQARYHYQSG